MGGKEIKFGVEGRAAMLKGVDLLADAVQVNRHSRAAARCIEGTDGRAPQFGKAALSE